MNFKVRLQKFARQDLREAYEWAHHRAPNSADKWFDHFREAIRSLEFSPERCPLAIERRKVALEIRELLFGRRPNVFRIIFHIDGSNIRVLRIRRGQRRPLTRHQIDEAFEAEDPMSPE